MEGKKIKMLVEAGLLIGMAHILSFISLYNMPQGGSMSISILPLLFFAMRWGGEQGVLMCTTYGILHFLLKGGYIMHPLSIILDYLVAYGVLGMVGFCVGSRNKVLWGIVVVCILRWCSSVVSGAVVFAAYAPAGQNPWVYSMLYNASYMFPETLLAVLITSRFYNRVLK